MTFSEDAKGTGKTVIKLRLNVPSTNTGNVPDQDNGQENQKSYNKPTSKQAPKGVVPLQLTKREKLQPPSPSNPLLQKPEDNEKIDNGNIRKLRFRLKATLSEGHAEKPIREKDKRPKIVLSVGKASVSTIEKTDKVDVVTLDVNETPQKEQEGHHTSKKVKLSDNSSSAPSKSILTSKTKRNRANQHPFSTIPALPQSTVVHPSSNPSLSSKMAIPSFRSSNLTRVPIASLSSLSSLTPGEREEERQYRICLSEIFGQLWPMVTKPNVMKEFETFDELKSMMLPYWLMFTPVDSAFNAPTLKSITNPDPPDQDRATRYTEEFTKLQSKFQDYILNEKNKEIATELLVLEQRLCLEEEKFLYAKLKNDYNTKVMELIAKKRAGDGHVNLNNNTNAVNMQPPQRILPKVSQSWVAGSGIKIIRPPHEVNDHYKDNQNT